MKRLRRSVHLSMTRTIGSVLVGLVLAAPSAAMGHDCEGVAQRGQIGARIFERVDGNRDGRVALGEAHAAARDRFARADADRDGIVRRDEAELWARLERARGLEQRFSQLDIDRDGVVSNRELAPGRRGFTRFDLDGDGVVTREELRRASLREKPLGHGRSWLGRFETWDLDRDGAVTRSEVQRSVDDLFRERDADRDGALSRAELTPGRRARR